MVSASGDASLRLIYAGAVAEVNIGSDPGVQGLLQGVPVAGEQHGRRQALRRLAAVRAERADLQHEDVREEADSWAAIYDPKNKGKITIPDNPIQIADAALYLSKTQAVARDQGPVRADEGTARRGGGTAQAAAAARQEVLGRSRPTRSTCSRTAARRSARRGRISAQQLMAAKAPVVDRDPEGRRHGLARHLDALVEGEAPELRLQVDAVHHLAEAAGAAGGRTTARRRSTRRRARS